MEILCYKFVWTVYSCIIPITFQVYDPLIISPSNQRLRSAFDVTRLSLLCQVGDDVIHPCKMCGVRQIRVPRSNHSISVVPYNLDSNLECVLSTSNAINVRKSGLPSKKNMQELVEVACHTVGSCSLGAYWEQSVLRYMT